MGNCNCKCGTPRPPRQLAFDIYDTSGKLHQVWIAGQGSTITLPQDVAFDYHDGGTDIEFRKTIQWRIELREVK